MKNFIKCNPHTGAGADSKSAKVYLTSNETRIIKTNYDRNTYYIFYNQQDKIYYFATKVLDPKHRKLKESYANVDFAFEAVQRKNKKVSK